jgi:threonine/homoserine/homoserine lactone efflux protein
MPPADRLLTFVLASVVLVVIPGPTVVFVVSRAIAHGRRAALRSVAGNSAGVSVLVVLVAFGLGSLVERPVAVYTVIKLVGAAYLVYLGVRVDRASGHVPTQMLLLGLAFVLLAMVLDSAWGLAAGTARGWLARSPQRLAALGGTGGLMMIGLGMGLAVTGRRE